MEARSTYLCCGVGEFQGINQPEFTVEKALMEIAVSGGYTKNNEHPGYGSCLFTAAWDDKKTPAGFNNSGRTRRKYVDRMKKLIKYIEENDLGDVVTMPQFRNPGHGSMVKPALWYIKRKKLIAWHTEHHKEPITSFTYLNW